MRLSESEKLFAKIRKETWKLNEVYQLIEPGDLVMVCLSGGKDSYTMLEVLLHMRQAMPFRIVAANLDQGQPGFPVHILPQYLQNKGIDFLIEQKDTYSIVVDKTPEGKTMCSMCSRLRRGHLYAMAKRVGATKIALGHHKDDVLETFFLNLFFSGKLEAMPPKYLTDDQQHIVIRPLSNCRERDIASFAATQTFPIIPCNLCGSQANLQRKNIKHMIAQWEVQFPDRFEVMFNALGNISPTHMLDTKLFDFTGLTASTASI